MAPPNAAGPVHAARGGASNVGTAEAHGDAPRALHVAESLRSIELFAKEIMPTV